MEIFKILFYNFFYIFCPHKIEMLFFCFNVGQGNLNLRWWFFTLMNNWCKCDYLCLIDVKRYFFTSAYNQCKTNNASKFGYSKSKFDTFQFCKNKKDIKSVIVTSSRYFYIYEGKKHILSFKKYMRKMWQKFVLCSRIIFKSSCYINIMFH